ncbi:MAG: hypothetical protein PHQ53_07350 [Candidatus Krumholzibacteria bacterium]|nr:hypothetical protein [Candidatus Krumholzibacteria bacterium]
MSEVHLILSIPQGVITATSLGVEGLAWHRSPGSGKHFKGRKLFVELAVADGQPDFEYLDEGGWRDTRGDTISALAAATAGKRTKTALSNNAFSCTPIEAYRRIYLVKTGGEVLEMEPGGQLHAFKSSDCREEMSPAEVASAAGCATPKERKRHIYMVMCPIQLLLVSNLTPIEYAWYATHRPGKVFRQVVFTELRAEQTHLAAQSRFTDARLELEMQPEKKTKTVVSEDCLNEVPFHVWLGYGRRSEGGLYVADQSHLGLWRFPATIPLNWDRVMG